jgi:hypothetical protein
MLMRLSLGALLGAVVMFGWGMVYWMVSPLSWLVMKPMPAESEAALIEATKTLPGEGVYFSPWPTEPSPGATPEEVAAKEKEFMDKHTRGPLIQIMYHPTGMECGLNVFLIGFAHMFVSGLLVGVLMNLAGLRFYLSRVGFVFLLGVFAAFVTHLADVFWMQYPVNFQLFMIGMVVTQWLIGGVFMAAIIRPPVPVAPPTEL